MLKNLLIWILTICICLPTLTFGEEISSSLQNAILKVKEIIDIPESYSEFTYSMDDSEIYGDKISIWRLNWTDTSNDKGNSISVSIANNGNIQRYTNYKFEDEQKGLPKFSSTQAQQTAEEFLNKALPKYIDNLKQTNSNLNSNSNEYYFEYKYFVNDIPVSFTSIGVNVNKFTNEITRLDCSGFEKEFVYPSLAGIMDESNAKSKYLDNLGINLKYYSYYDYSSKNLNIFDVYTLKNNIVRKKAIDAYKGNIVNLYNQSYYGARESMASGAYDKDAGNSMSFEEITAVENTSNLITKEEAENIILQKSEIIKSDIKADNYSLSKSNIDKNKFIWSISFDEAFGQVDARTGELISFSCYNYSEDENRNLSKSQAQDLAQKFLNENVSQKFENTKYDSSYSDYEDENSNIYSFRFVRQVNGIDFVDNYLTVTVNKNIGKIISYNSNWYDSVKFSDIGNVISNKEALDIMADALDFRLQYSITDDNKIIPVYNFMSLESDYLLDPIKSVRIDYTGKEFKDTDNPISYTDIAGHWCEEFVNKLLENGYYIKSEKFNPNNRITQLNFFKYLYSPNQVYYTDDEFYDMLVNTNMLEKENINPNATISRKDASKYICRYLGYEKIAQHPEIFVNHFKDDLEKKYMGYAAIACAVGVMEIDKLGNFNGNYEITNADTALVIYNLLNIK